MYLYIRFEYEMLQFLYRILKLVCVVLVATFIRQFDSNWLNETF